MGEVMYDDYDDEYDYDEHYDHDFFDDDWDDYDRCYECAGYGDDYFINDEDELECACPTCWNNPNRWDDDDHDIWDD